MALSVARGLQRGRVAVLLDQLARFVRVNGDPRQPALSAP
jgi:hypothetical protein